MYDEVQYSNLNTLIMDSRDFLIEILKEKYTYELSRKSYYDCCLVVPITLMSFLVAGIFITIGDEQVWSTVLCARIFLYALLGLIIAGCIVSFVFLFIVFFGFKRSYNSMPDSDVVNESYSVLVKRHEKEKKDKEEYLVSDLKEYMIRWYSLCNTDNTKTNDRRGNALYSFRLSIGITMIMGVILLIT